MIETKRSERDRDEEKRGKIARKKETDRAREREKERERNEEETDKSNHFSDLVDDDVDDLPPIIRVVPPPGIAPPGVPQPGEFGGGDPPANNPDAAALAPPGTVPVAVFPPYIRPRTFPAVCVIFSELTKYETDYGGHRHYGRRRRKRGLFSFPWRQHQELKRKGNSSHHDKGGRKVITLQRRFGFRCRVRLVQERCQLGETCDAAGNKLRNFSGNNLTDQLLRRQTGEEFRSDSNPDCRVELAPDGCQ